MPDLKDGARSLRVLTQEMKDTRKLQNEMARAILAKARSNAASRPTPQARMVSRAMIVTRGVVLGRANRMILGGGEGKPVKLGFLLYGSEFGSFHRQFGAPWTSGPGSGYWLHPAAEGRNPQIDKAEESFLDRAINTAIRAAGI
jgi:hypothetical protein